MEFDVPIKLLRTMLANTVYLWLCMLISNGVFGVDEVKSVSVMEGDSVTLHTDITQIQRDDQILWSFVPQDPSEALHVAEIIEKKSLIYDDDDRFRNKLQLDNHTGSLTITNFSSKHSGVYKVQINSKTPSNKRFNVTVYGQWLPSRMDSLDHSWPLNTVFLLLSVLCFWLQV